MIVFIAALIGAAYGAFAARRKGGKGWDVAHYAAAYGIAFSLVGVLATIIITRTMV
ncbi:apolipoprotein acyltransferase [Chachezhania antarctica]|uniref:apolipoprotein acyltransferase n=1 Tax=Chachezhania antarctica TaxID=2340860 RepID=UPI000EB081D2|nr:apolipoprotein acyltransferase [Chachezhania antarctica]|tara:strand:+ start:5756 stop:5923 length:168 start_codon:yes stop_codon:yes gene_type:complete